MFYNIQRTGTQATKYSNHIKKELTIAKRFFSIVITDSLCWIPIFILKILSLMQVEIPGELDTTDQQCLPSGGTSAQSNFRNTQERCLLDSLCHGAGDFSLLPISSSQQLCYCTQPKKTKP